MRLEWRTFHRSPVGDHRSNGLAKRQVRVLRSSLEEMIDKVLREDDPVLAWLPQQRTAGPVGGRRAAGAERYK